MEEEEEEEEDRGRRKRNGIEVREGNVGMILRNELTRDFTVARGILTPPNAFFLPFFFFSFFLFSMINVIIIIILIISYGWVKNIIYSFFLSKV